MATVCLEVSLLSNVSEETQKTDDTLHMLRGTYAVWEAIQGVLRYGNIIENNT